jgi:hypothetical protein
MTMSTPHAKPARRRGTAAEEAKLAIDAALHDGVALEAMTLRMTLRDASELKRDPKVATADISFSPDGMRYLGVVVDQGGGVTVSVLDRGDTSYRRGAAEEAAAAAAAKPKPKARKKAAPKVAAEATAE